MVQQIVWHGTLKEAEALELALRNNCGCKFGKDGARTSTCPGHYAFVNDQRFVDHLLFMRRTRACLMREEFTASKRQP